MFATCTPEPPLAVIVDPFAGSGSTGKAAILEGFQFIGFELDPQYTAIANARLEAARTSMKESA
jgi:site-specific DNA-methyltransferase (adenine-specific)